LVQWDTSEHDWLEGRGPVRYLVRMIDDATSWSWGRFVERDAGSGFSLSASGADAATGPGRHSEPRRGWSAGQRRPGDLRV